MNRSTFLELLNLYIDAELSPAEAAELEEEILTNREHRRIYDEYCRIHRATRLVYDRFREAAARQTDDGVRSFQETVRLPVAAPLTRIGDRRVPSAVWLGSAVAAACAAVFAGVLLLPRANAPREPVQAAATRAVATPTRPDAAAPGNPATFAAPYVQEIRIDPYFTQAPASRPDPFAMDPRSGPAWKGDPAAAPRLVPTGTLSSPFDDLARGYGLIPVDAESETSRVIRSRDDGERLELEPVGYHIHR